MGVLRTIAGWTFPRLSGWVERGTANTIKKAMPHYVPVRIAMAEDPGYTISGKIWSASERFLRIMVRRPIAIGQHIQLSIDQCIVKGEVVFCQLCPEGHNVGVQLLDRDSVRREPRFPLDVPAVLTVVGSGGPTDEPVQLADVSASGVGLFSGRPVQVGACVEISLELGIIFGEVRHCRAESDGRFRVGISLYHMLAREGDSSAAGQPQLLRKA